MNVVLIGMKHCGKSTVGQGLAARWACAFHDVDPMVEAWHACETNEQLSVRQILARYGEDRFCKIEGLVICELYMKLSRPDSTAVVALGGRTALNESISVLLSGIGLRVYLQVSSQELWARLDRVGAPPFLGEKDPQGAFFALCSQRLPAYERLADVTVNLQGLSPEASVDRVAQCVEEQLRGGQ